MKSKLVLIIVLLFWLLFLSHSSFAISPDKIPLGIQISDPNTNRFTNSLLKTLSDTLGFNFVYLCDPNIGFPSGTRTLFSGNGMDVISYLNERGSDSLNIAFKDYLTAHYYITQTKDTISPIRFFRGENGHDSSETEWYVAFKNNNQRFTFLDNLWFNHIWQYLGIPIVYTPSMFIRLDPESNANPNDTVAFLNVFKSDGDWWSEYGISIPTPTNRHAILLNTSPITVGRLDSIGKFIDLGAFSCEDCDDFASSYVTYQIESTGKYSFAVDTFMVTNAQGRDLMAGVNDSRFRTYCSSHQNDSTILCWQLKDDMRVDEMLPARHMGALIDSSTNNSKSGMMKYFEPWFIPPGYFLSKAQPRRFWIDPYPFWGKYTRNDSTFGLSTMYAGYGLYYDDNLWGLQIAIDSLVIKRLRLLKEAITDSCPGTELWYMAQLQSEHLDSTIGYEHRIPTGTEMSMEAFTALTFGIKGLQYWPCFSQEYSGTNVAGLIGADGQYTDARTKLETYVIPNLQAIDSYLADPNTVWDRSYDSFHIGSGYVTSIRSWSNDFNPDSGWAQIGEFHNDTIGVKYILLVNRACSSDALAGITAPPQHFTLRFNPSALNLGNYVLITDLADTVVDSSGQWIGIPRITYSGVMPDGKIPYSITLKAGEGKLIKISPASEFRGGQIDTTCDYQGQIFADRDIVIPSGHEMRVKSPAIFEITSSDSVNEGISSSLIEIINYGALKVKGSIEDTVIFRAFPVGGAGSWYGIRDLSNGHDTLTYCLIKYAYNGFCAETNANALIRHCEISNCENNAVYLYNTNSSLTTIDSSFITDNGNSAINSNSSYFFARANTITDNDAYGIYFQDQYVSIPQLIISDNTIEQGDGSAQAGICIRGNQTSNNWPWANLSGNFIEGFDQEGVYLYYCKTGSSSAMALSGGNYLYSNNPYGLVCQESSPQIYSAAGSCEEYNFFVSNTVHGIYFIGSSTSKVSKASFEGNGMANVSCGTNSTPNFGDDTFNGENSFSTVDSSDFDIMNFTSKKINAKGNWWGEDTVDTDDFYPSINSFNLGRTITDPCPGIPSLARYESGELIPTVFALHQNYPNPFNPSTTIEFDLPQDSWVRLSVYNVLGQRIKTLLNAQYAAGTHEVIWDGRNESGGEVSSGVYFYLLETDSFRDAKKMLMIR